MPKKRRRVVQFARNLIKFSILLLFRIQKVFLLRNPKIEDIRIKNILIFGYMGIGDMIMFTPALKLLRKKYPNAKITLQYGQKSSVEKAIINSNLIDEFSEIYLDGNFFKFIRHGLKSRGQYDLLISEFHNSYFQLGFQILYMNIPLRMTHSTSPGYQNPMDFLFNYQVKMREDEHTIERELDLLRPLGIHADFEVEKGNTEIYLSDNDRVLAESFWRSQNLTEEFVFGIQAGTSSFQRWKQWPVHCFRSLIEKLNSRNYKIILFGSPSEREMLEQIANNIVPAPIIMAGESGFLEACGLIAKCNYMITNDSGLMHVANALNVPLLAIYGPTDYRRTAPLSKISKIIRMGLECSPCFKLEGDNAVTNCPFQYKCLRELTAESVIDAIQLTKISV